MTIDAVHPERNTVGQKKRSDMWMSLLCKSYFPWHKGGKGAVHKKIGPSWEIDETT